MLLYVDSSSRACYVLCLAGGWPRNVKARVSYLYVCARRGTCGSRPVVTGSGDTTDQFVWGPAYVDELLLRERDADGDPNNVLDQRLYAAHDTLYSVLELVDEDGNVVEQYSYSPYGADP